MSTPLLSVVIPTYNRKDLLKECLDSLFDQTYPKEDYEIVVVDDGSTDGTEDMLKAMAAEHGNLRYFRQENGGPATAKNRGVKNSRGNTVVFLDSDCSAPAILLASMQKLIQKYPDIAAFVGDIILIPKNRFFKKFYDLFEITKPKILPMRIFDKPFPVSRFYSGCAAVRRDAYEKAGGFDERFKWAGEDANFGFKLLEKGFMICNSWDIYTYHHEKDPWTEFVARNFYFGISDVLGFKEHFSGWEVVSTCSDDPRARGGMNFSFFIHFNMIKTMILLSIISAAFPVAGSSLLLIFLLKHYMRTARVGGDPMTFVAYIAYRLLTDTPRLAGWIAGSIRYGVIYL
ncbi:MAG: glycosyltransferase family 2 protein [Candidatus Omnitrophota bacterium]